MLKFPLLNVEHLIEIEQLCKIEEEFNEVLDAVREGTKEQLISEVLDLIQASTTMLLLLGINEKHLNRHYYKLQGYEAQGKLKLLGNLIINLEYQGG